MQTEEKPSLTKEEIETLKGMQIFLKVIYTQALAQGLSGKGNLTETRSQMLIDAASGYASVTALLSKNRPPAP